MVANTYHSIFTVLLLMAIYGCSTPRSDIAERLGYPSDTKLLILHADDMGISHSENMASIKALEEGPVNSASIMVPCPGFSEIAAYAKKNQSADLGLHLTLTSEWKNYKWGPVTARDSVASLVNEDGNFHPATTLLTRVGKPDEVELELRNQVKKAYRSGIDVTHLDAHMGTAFSTPEYTSAYMKVGREFDLPVMLDKDIYDFDHDTIETMLDDKTIVVDQIYTMMPEDFKKGAANYYTKVLKDLKPGLNCLIVHVAYEDEEMKMIMSDRMEWGAEWRQADLDFFTSYECGQLIEENGIVLITWREIRDKIVRAE